MDRVDCVCTLTCEFPRVNTNNVFCAFFGDTWNLEFQYFDIDWLALVCFMCVSLNVTQSMFGGRVECVASTIYACCRYSVHQARVVLQVVCFCLEVMPMFIIFPFPESHHFPMCECAPQRREGVENR